MPKRNICGDFVVDPNYEKARGISHTTQEICAKMNRELQYIDSISNSTFQLICMFSMIDCMAQESADYPRSDSRATFCDFVLKHQSRYNYLDMVEPITLYYHVEDLIDESVLIPGFPPEKEVDIDSLGYIDLCGVRDLIHSRKAEEILGYIAKKKGDSFAQQKANEHSMINLIYRMRSKATHEMTGLGEESWNKTECNMTEPYYRDVGRIYVVRDKVVSDDICELVIPNTFIRNILTDCIDSYFSECSKQCRLPFSNNPMTRTHRLSWYDK